MRRTRPSPRLNVSKRSLAKNTRDFGCGLPPANRLNLVHREGFEPSYLRGGADLQSAGFNHSPTCAELQNSPACAAYIRHSSQIFTPAYGDRSDGFCKSTDFANVKNRNARENAIARKHHIWKIPLWSAVGKSVKPSRILRPEPMLELAKGFEPLTL